MSEAKHSAKPWWIDPGTNWILANANFIGEVKPVQICSVWKKGSDAETRANARLIAAAPEIAEAGRPFAKAADNYADCEDAKFIDADATITVGDLREMRAALAQADGAS
jgi:hypothetical protein